MKPVTAQFTWMTRYAEVVDCSLAWHPENPFAVNATFLNPDNEEVEWTFGLSLLTDITEDRCLKSGLGDVRTARADSFPGATQFRLYLSSPSGYIELVTLMSVIKAFTDKVKEAMGTDEAVVDVDLAISRLLSEDWEGPLSG